MKQRNADVSPRPSSRRVPIAALAVAAASSALLAAGCGGSSGASGGKVAQVESTQTTTSTTAGVTGRSKREALVAFSACMRRNGVPKFPDPEVVGSGMRLSFGSENGIDPNAPQFKRAQRACRNLLPNGGKSTARERSKRLQQALDYAACMRGHGVPNYPDPKAASDGGIDLGEFGPGAGVDPNSPQFKAAYQACKKQVPGAPLGPGPGEKP
jgi:hypothetical protein